MVLLSDYLKPAATYHLEEQDLDPVGGFQGAGRRYRAGLWSSFVTLALSSASQFPLAGLTTAAMNSWRSAERATEREERATAALDSGKSSWSTKAGRKRGR
ncbi:hypothetical protein VTK56DRAFT_6995 [Thermocarpiscus australiensis]